MEPIDILREEVMAYLRAAHDRGSFSGITAEFVSRASETELTDLRRRLILFLRTPS